MLVNNSKRNLYPSGMISTEEIETVGWFRNGAASKKQSIMNYRVATSNGGDNFTKLNE